MRRTKAWWARLTEGERVFLVNSERESYGVRGSAYLPDDCRECPMCSTPHSGFGGLCPPCRREQERILAKAAAGA